MEDKQEIIVDFNEEEQKKWGGFVCFNFIDGQILIRANIFSTGINWDSVPLAGNTHCIIKHQLVSQTDAVE